MKATYRRLKHLPYSHLLQVDYQREEYSIEFIVPKLRNYCEQTFGPEHQRWFDMCGNFYFKDKKDATLFKLSLGEME